jgi:hypothetical protein
MSAVADDASHVHAPTCAGARIGQPRRDGRGVAGLAGRGLESCCCSSSSSQLGNPSTARDVEQGGDHRHHNSYHDPHDHYNDYELGVGE